MLIKEELNRIKQENCPKDQKETNKCPTHKTKERAKRRKRLRGIKELGGITSGGATVIYGHGATMT